MQSTKPITSLNTLRSTYFVIFPHVYGMAYLGGWGGEIKKLRNISCYKRE